MKFTDRIFLFALAMLSRVPFVGKAVDRYESATQKWGQRSWINASIQDAKYDANASTRTELVRRSRYWERNNGIVQRLIDLFEQFTVGANGIQFIANSSDEAWNLKAADWWNEWSRFPDLTSKQTLGTLQGLCARSWFVDGEIFLHKTQSPDTQRPRVELIEAHRVRTPADKQGEEGKGIIDGVKVDASGWPVGYYVKDGPEKDDWILIDAANLVHLFEPGRPGQYRGLPMLYPVMNDLHDLDDLQQYEMTAAKDAASVTNVITNAAGEAMSPAQMRRTKLQVQTTDASGNPVTKNADQYFEVLTGARNVMLKTGEDMKQFQSNRPSVATREYWDYLTAKICAGVGISRLLVFPYSMQGTVTRADLDVSAVFFRSRSKIIETAFREIYIWVMQWACTFDSRLAGYPKADWFKANARPPRSPNVDVGRNSAAVIAETEAGLRTYQDNYAELGEDWRQQFEQRAQERAYAHQLAEKYGLDVNEIAALTIASNASEAQPAERGGGSTQSATP